MTKTDMTRGWKYTTVKKGKGSTVVVVVSSDRWQRIYTKDLCPPSVVAVWTGSKWLKGVLMELRGRNQGAAIDTKSFIRG